MTLLSRGLKRESKVIGTEERGQTDRHQRPGGAHKNRQVELAHAIALDPSQALQT